MPITIPKIDRFEPQASQSIGRTNYSIPSQAENLQQLSEVITNTAQRVEAKFDEEEKIYQKAIKNAQEVKTDEVTNQFNLVTNDMLNGPNGAKHKEGDPVPVYQKLDADVKSYRESLMDQYKGMPDEAKAMLDRKLVGAETAFRVKADTQYGSQYNTYQDNVTNDTVKILQNQLMEDTGTVDPARPESFALMDSTVGKIMQSRQNNASRKGLVNADGTMHLSTAAVISKDLSDGIYNAIEGLNAKNYPLVAEAVRNKYRSFLDPVNLAKADKNIETAKIDYQAQLEYQKVAGLGFAEANKQLDKLSNKPEVQKKATQFLMDAKARDERLNKMASAQSYKGAYEIVSNQMNSANPYVSVNEMESDPAIKPFLKNITEPNERKALQAMVSRPQQSDVKQLTEMFQLNKNGQLTSMAPADFEKATNKLNRDDYLLFRNQYTAYQKPKKEGLTESEERSRVKYMNDEVEKYARMYNIIPEGKPEELPDDEKKHYNKLMQGFNSFYQTLPEKMSISDQDTYVKQYMTQFAKENPAPKTWFGFGGPRRTYDLPQGVTPRNVVTPPKGSPAASTKQPTPVNEAAPINASSDLDSMNSTQVSGWMDRYRADNGGQDPDDFEVLQKYINSKSGKK